MSNRFTIFPNWTAGCARQVSCLCFEVKRGLSSLEKAALELICLILSSMGLCRRLPNKSYPFPLICFLNRIETFIFFFSSFFLRRTTSRLLPNGWSLMWAQRKFDGPSDVANLWSTSFRTRWLATFESTASTQVPRQLQLLVQRRRGKEEEEKNRMKKPLK